MLANAKSLFCVQIFMFEMTDTLMILQQQIFIHVKSVNNSTFNVNKGRVMSKNEMVKL